MHNRQPRDQLAGDIANWLDQELGSTRKAGPNLNPFGSAWQSRLDISEHGYARPLLHWGRIADYVPRMNSYRVMGEYGGTYTCTMGSLTGHQSTGVRQGTVLPVGCAVLFYTHPQTLYGTIVCVDPDYHTDPRNLRYDFVTLGGNSGFDSDSAHTSQVTLLQGHGGHACFNGQRPGDTIAGDWNFGSETGLMIHMDPFMGFFRVDEETGLFLHYHDQMTRLAGHNLQVRTQLGEREELDDQQESIGFAGLNPYFWERKGAWTYGTTVHTERASALLQQSLQEYANLEPLHDDQQPFDRVLDFDGYLGQGFKKMVCAPPDPAPGSVNRYSSSNKYTGLFNMQASLDGSFALESAKRVGIWKRSCIPVPKMMIRPEDELGDNETNYKAAGLFGSGEAHKSASDITVTSGVAELVRASAILDLAALTFNWSGVHPFFYHHRDWYIPDECEADKLNTNQLPPSFCNLQGDQYLSAPTPIDIHIDHRTIAAKYYPTESFMQLLEDGGVVIGDGFGSEIRMTGGSITLSAPGDINILPGKNVNCWAGWDFVAKAFNSADITASRKDVRIKAESNVQIMGGNDTFGGVLIESRASCVGYNFDNAGEAANCSGIVLTSKKAPIMAYGSDVVIKTASTPGSGTIKLQAGDTSDKDIKFYCTNQESFLGQARFDFFSNGANEFWPTYTTIGSPTRVNGRIVGTDGMSLKGWLTIANGSVSSEQATTYQGQITQLSAPGISTINTDVAYAQNRVNYLKGTLRTQQISSTYSDKLNTELRVAEFSYRTMADYRTSGFLLFESRWQQLARLGNGIPAKWVEPPVSTTAVGATYPHPGEAWVNSGYYHQDLKLYSIPYGASLDRTSNQSLYETPSYAAPIAVVFDNNYPIIRKC